MMMPDPFKLFHVPRWKSPTEQMGMLKKEDAMLSPEQAAQQEIFILFSPPKPGLLGQPLSIKVTGDARLVRFEPPEKPLRAGESFSFVIEWVSPEKLLEHDRLEAKYLVKMEVVAPARMFQSV